MINRPSVGACVVVNGRVDGITFRNDIGIVAISNTYQSVGIDFGCDHRTFDRALHNLNGKIQSRTGWFVPLSIIEFKSFDIGL